MVEMDFPMLVLAQEAEVTPPLPGEAIDPGLTGTNGATGDPGVTGGGAAPTGGDPFGGAFIPIMIALLLGMIIFTTWTGRKEKKRKDQMLADIKKHDVVQTIGGVVGSIVDVKKDQVVLKVDESSNTRITFARSAIQQVISTGRNGAPAEAKDGESAKDQ